VRFRARLHREIDYKSVNAQQARRCFRPISGVMNCLLFFMEEKKIKRGLSAGRVQSVSVRLIVDAEEFRNFSKSYSIVARF
jgi:DNA topoisomerase-1